VKRLFEANEILDATLGEGNESPLTPKSELTLTPPSNDMMRPRDALAPSSEIVQDESSVCGNAKVRIPAEMSVEALRTTDSNPLLISCPPARLIDALRAKLVLATPQVGHDDGRKRVMLGPDVVEMENVTLATTSNM